MIRQGNGISVSTGWLLTGVAIGIIATIAVSVGPGREQISKARAKVRGLSASKPARTARVAAARVRATASDPNRPVRQWLERAAGLAVRKPGSTAMGSSLELTEAVGNGSSSPEATRRRRAAQPAEV